MFPLNECIFFIAIIIIAPVNSQVLPPKCVPKGRCFHQEPKINPRGPNSEAHVACDPTEDLCYPLEEPMKCGTIYVPNVSILDGNTSMGWHPWQVYMRNETGKYMGSGVLITPFHVLTIAHKVYLNKNSPENVEIFLGVNNPFTSDMSLSIRRTAALISIHDGFAFTSAGPVDYKNNLAIIQLDQPVEMGYRIDIGLGCLPRPEDTFIGLRCIVAGWGESEFGKGDSGIVHKQVGVAVVDIDTCKASMEQPYVLGEDDTAKYLDMDRELCAGGEQSLDACTEDGGAPLMCQPLSLSRTYIAGLVNWGKGCGRPGVYGVYVDISKYVDWIKSIIT